MTPTELRTALQGTFDIRLSPPQLGAVVHLFGMGGDDIDAEACDGGIMDAVRRTGSTPNPALCMSKVILRSLFSISIFHPPCDAVTKIQAAVGSFISISVFFCRRRNGNPGCGWILFTVSHSRSNSLNRVNHRRKFLALG